MFTDQQTYLPNDLLVKVDIAAMAHGLRTPLAILRGEAELALRPSASDEERRQALMRQIDECDRLTRLINQILTLARAGAGDITMASGRVELILRSSQEIGDIERPDVFQDGSEALLNLGSAHVLLVAQPDLDTGSDFPPRASDIS